MAYSAEVYQKVAVALEERHNNAVHYAGVKKRELYDKIPELTKLDGELAKNMAKLSAVAMSEGEKSEKALADMQKKCEEIKKKKAALLEKKGYCENYLEPDYYCKLCGDTGRVNGILCSCYKELCEQIAMEELDSSSGSTHCSFDNFDLKYYPDNGSTVPGANPHTKMSNVFDYFRKYAAEFSKNSRSVLMTGKTGLGKTHLSLSVAKEVVKKGYGVMYCPAQQLCSRLEHEHFSKCGEEESMKKFIGCDLLIIDDLGAEFNSQFAVAIIGDLINERLIRKKPTLISTNLTTEDIVNRYTERTASRLLNDYVTAPFIGDDIRQIKKMRKEG